MRADAQRNYDKLVDEARQAFLVHGTDVALEDIARHAGVGVGTLYRHFPDRYALMNAVFEKELNGLSEQAERSLLSDDPAAALTRWLRAVAVYSRSYRGLSLAIMEGSGSKMPACKVHMRRAGGALLARAQEAGVVRSDVEIGDLLKITYAIVSAVERNPEEKGLFDRLMSLAVDGMRTRCGEAPGGGAQVPAVSRAQA